MTRSEVPQNPLLPTNYDVVWSVVVLVVLALSLVGVVMVVRSLRSGSRRRAEADMVPDPVEQVRRLAELRDVGAIGQQEYEARKNGLLGPS